MTDELPGRVIVVMVLGGLTRSTILTTWADYGARGRVALVLYREFDAEESTSRLLARVRAVLGTVNGRTDMVLDITGSPAPQAREVRLAVRPLIEASRGALRVRSVHTSSGRSEEVPRADLAYHARTRAQARRLDVGGDDRMMRAVVKMRVDPPRSDMADPWRETEDAERSLTAGWACWHADRTYLPDYDSIPAGTGRAVRIDDISPPGAGWSHRIAEAANGYVRNVMASSDRASTERARQEQA